MADLNDVTKWFEADGSNTQAPPNGWPAGMLPNQVEPTAQAMMGALKRFWNRINAVYPSSGAAGVYQVTPSNTSYPSAYVQGERYAFKAHQASAGNDTLNWNGLGAKKLYMKNTAGTVVPIAANDIAQNQQVDAFFDAVLDSSAGGFQVPGTSLSGIAVPPGVVVPYIAATAPSGWLVCNGQAVSRTTYAALFAVIDTTYGAGNGSTTFNVPDLRGRVPAGFDPANATGRLTGASGGVSAAALANAGGAQTHALSSGEMPSHGHGVNDGGHAHTFFGGSAYFDGLFASGFGGADSVVTAAGSNHAYGSYTDAAGTGISIQSAGGNGTHNNVQPAVILNFIIKA